jgi:DNA-binding NarL/FixJ family response regulator
MAWLRPPHFALPLLHSTQVEVLIEQGDLDGAELVLVGSGLAGNAATPGSCFFLWLLYARGRLHFARGDYTEALSDFRECGRIYLQWAPALLDLPWRSRAADALGRLGEHDEAMSLVRSELELARSFGAARPLGIALTSAAALAEHGESIGLLKEAIAVLEQCPARLELARAVEALGVALSQAGQRDPGRQAFRRALQLALECRASGLAERTRARLAAGGGRPPRLWLTGVRSLTPSERRVAQLAARQLTNRQIAETLNVTEKTVEAHLSRVYRKLQASSRWQLMAKLGDPAAESSPAG